MDNAVIRAENLSKKYNIRVGSQRHDTLRDQVSNGLRSIFRRDAFRRPNIETFWALRGLSLEIKAGEVVGIIGRNGAGKSTLLKILARIVDPTEGHAMIHGRIGSLLEVGTGFHPELTGRENVYFNGAILGMKKREIDRKFDEIVDFSEIGKFIDTPVKRYSSGMYVRLAFAVAAHLETEVLIVDEVLAVGDVRFQGKCIEKMNSATKEGRTILFVSHNMEAMTRLCPRIILLEAGRLLLDGTAKESVSMYLNLGIGRASYREWDPKTAPGGDLARLCSVAVRDMNGAIIESVDIRQPFRVEMEYEVFKPGFILLPNFHFCTDANLHLFSVHDSDPEWRTRPRPVGRYTSVVYVPGNFLSDGTHVLTFELTSLRPVLEDLFTSRESIAFKVIDSPGEESSARGDWEGPMGGVVRPMLSWSTRFSPSSELAEAGRMASESNS